MVGVGDDFNETDVASFNPASFTPCFFYPGKLLLN